MCRCVLSVCHCTHRLSLDYTSSFESIHGLKRMHIYIYIYRLGLGFTSHSKDVELLKSNEFQRLGQTDLHYGVKISETHLSFYLSKQVLYFNY